jgi:signal transduction histidine kinase
VVAVLALRHGPAGDLLSRAGVLALGALGLAAYAVVPGRAASSVGLCCLILAVVLCSRLGWFGVGLAGFMALPVLAATIGRYGEQPLALVVGAFVGIWMYIGPVLGRFNRRVMLQEAASEERARLAREIHDVLAHTLSALSVQIEGARMLLEQRPGDPRAVAAMERAQRLVTAGIEETGRAVAALRGDVLPVPDALRRLAEDFERESAVPCRLDVEGTPLALSPDASLAIYRAAQEALTNVRRHTEASEVRISLRYRDGRAELTVADRGAPKESPSSSGYGLVGIRERTKLLGGELEAGPTADGFQVRLSVPA